MPHITDAEKKALETRSVVKMGDACFLFAKYAIDQFNAKRSWTTIHEIRRALSYPFHNDATLILIQEKMGHMGKVDVEVAADLAFTEFYRLVGSQYEDMKIGENGNALDLIEPLIPPITEVKRGRGRPRKEATNV